MREQRKYDILEEGWSSTTSHIAVLQVSTQPCGFGSSTVFSHMLMQPPIGTGQQTLTHTGHKVVLFKKRNWNWDTRSESNPPDSFLNVYVSVCGYTEAWFPN